MIKSLTIRNFQSHKDTTFGFSPGVNLIVGQSDSGKTAIIRALRWLATNRPSGDNFRSSWGGDTSVSVKVDETTIQRLKGKINCYYIKDYEPWTALGTEVPEKVIQALNTNELSWQSQMDPPFLLSASPGEVARTLNEVADLDKIDSTLANINRMARDNRSELMTTAEHKRDLEISLSAFKGLDERMKKIAQLKEMNRKTELLEEMFTNGEDMLEEIEQKNKQLAAVKDMTDAEAELNLLMDMVGQIRQVEDMIDKMEKQRGDIDICKSNLQVMTDRLERLEKIWKEKSRGQCPLCGRSG
jgi:exonuclease SbcC